MTRSASPRLAIVVNDAPFFLSHRLPIALAAREAGYDVHVVTPPHAMVADVARAGLPWHPISLVRSSRAPWRELVAMRDLVRTYRRLRPDIVHHVTPKPVLYGTVAARLTGVPAIVNAISGMGHVFAHESGAAHALLRRGVRAGYGMALRHPRMRVIFQNDDARDDFVRAGWVTPEQVVMIRGSGVDVARYATALPRPERVPTVVLAARLLWTKGVGEFVAAAERLLADGVVARFVLVGEPDPNNPAAVPDDVLRRWVDAGTVEWWGHRLDMERVLDAADVACLPSYLEGLPKSLIEAAAAGLPIVTTDVPGCREVVRDGEGGLLVPSNAVEPLADALRRLIEDPALRTRMGAESRRRAEAEFTLGSVVRAHLALYDALSAER